MAQNYKIKNTLKNLPFYSEEIKDSKKKNKILSELPFFSKKLSNIQLSKELHFFPKRCKIPKRLTKYQVLKNMLPFYDSVFQEYNMLIKIMQNFMMLKLLME